MPFWLHSRFGEAYHTPLYPFLAGGRTQGSLACACRPCLLPGRAALESLPVTAGGAGRTQQPAVLNSESLRTLILTMLASAPV